MIQKTAPRCAFIADDLTGACDAAAPFKLRGARTIVCIKELSSTSHEVVALSTESRDLDICAARERIREAAARLAALDPTIVFKKIDSTLRGNIGAEIAMVLEAFGCDFAIITPAFPSLGRLIRNGRLHLEGDAGWQPIGIADRLRAQGLGDCVHLASDVLERAIESGQRFISVEAACDGDLDAIVAATFRFGRRVLYAGSAGLAAAVAKMFFGSMQRASPHEAMQMPCIFCVGSDHPVTLGQLSALSRERPVEWFAAGSAQPESLAGCLQSGHHAVVTVSRGADCGAMRELLESAGRCAALLLSGGDTAFLVCSALGTEAIEIEGEIAIGLPWGRLRGGLLDGLAVATKSGGFGASDALIRVADFFTCQAN